MLLGRGLLQYHLLLECIIPNLVLVLLVGQAHTLFGPFVFHFVDDDLAGFGFGEVKYLMILILIKVERLRTTNIIIENRLKMVNLLENVVTFTCYTIFNALYGDLFIH